MKYLVSLILIISYAVALDTNKLFDDVKKTIAELESSSYQSINARGFIGRYQFGAMALVDIGLVKKENYQNATFIYKNGNKNKVVWKFGNLQSFLANKDNWNDDLDLEKFLHSQKIQEEAMNKLLSLNLKRLKDKGLSLGNLSALKALLVAAHLGGIDSAIAYALADKDYQDAFGTSIKKYFDAGAGSKTLAAQAKKYLGNKYVWGGTDPNVGADCSGYVQYLYKAVGINLPRTAWQQSKTGKEVSLSEVQVGDLLFFQTDEKRGIPITHVGMYIGDDKFIHAASSKEGIIVSRVATYQKTFVKAKRILKENEKKALNIESFLSTKVTPQKSNTKLSFGFDPLVKVNGTYIRKSQLKE